MRRRGSGSGQRGRGHWQPFYRMVESGFARRYAPKVFPFGCRYLGWKRPIKLRYPNVAPDSNYCCRFRAFDCPLRRGGPDHWPCGFDPHRSRAPGSATPGPFRRTMWVWPIASAELSHITLILQPGPGLDAFLTDLQNPASPDYHRWLTPEQFADRFGLSAGDIGKLTAWLQSEGLRVNDVARGSHWITFSGSIARLAHAFHTEFHRYAVKGKVHIANATDPSVPEAFAGVVAGFSGLNDFRPVPLVVEAGTRYTSSSGNHYLAPDDFAVIYDLEPALLRQGIDGTGVSIAIAGAERHRRFRYPAVSAAFQSAGQRSAGGFVRFGSGPQRGRNGGGSGRGVVGRGGAGRQDHLREFGQRPAFRRVCHRSESGAHSQLQLLRVASRTTVSLRSIAQQANAQGITWMASAGDSGAATCDCALLADARRHRSGPPSAFQPICRR